MDLVGYVDQWSAHPGESLRFHVSCRARGYTSQLLRLHQADPHPAANGIREAALDHPVNGENPGHWQPIHTGSCLLIPRLPPLSAATLAFDVYPTLTTPQLQTLFALHCEEDLLSLSLLADGRPQLCLRTTPATAAYAVAPQAIAIGQWYRVAVHWCGDSVQVQLRRYHFHPVDHGSQRLTLARPPGRPIRPQRLLLAALDYAPGQPVQQPFNGRIADPLLWGDADAAAALTALQANGTPLCPPLARWDFVREADSDRVPDVGGAGLHGQAINRPTRLVTGPSFDGSTDNPFAAPAQFNVAHFHEDDLADAGWEPGLVLTVPDTMPSGVYALALRSGDAEDRVPFFVTPRIGRPRATIAVLLPTVSYQVYANVQFSPEVLPAELVPLALSANPAAAANAYVRSHGLRSCYDRHPDGSGVCMASLRRPLPVGARPSYVSDFNSSLHQLGADLYLLDWLDAQGFACDVITDHELHRHGMERLADYRVVLSGSHAEYWTGPMLDALAAYQQQGGRFMYLSGNGLYWVTALSADGSLVEVRRDHGTRAWESAPGEAYLSLSGERGGLWRHRGRAPQRYVGVGFASQGFDRGQPYRRSAASYDPRFAPLFAGIEGESLGDFPARVSAYGAAGYEIDRADTSLGTPAHAVVLASATGFSDCYQLAVEDAIAMTPHYGGQSHPDVRADLVYFDTPGHGAVLSVGSIAWVSALGHNRYQNDVSRFTANALRAFLCEGPPFPQKVTAGIDAAPAWSD